MKILVANLGSTSLKYRLYDLAAGEERLLAKGGFERVTDYGGTIRQCLQDLQEGGHVSGPGDLAGVGFKAVLAHNVQGCVEMDDTVLEAMAFYNSVAPAHNPPYLTGVRLFREVMPGVPLVGLFETSFYQWIPEPAKRYAVPGDWYQMGVRRWGFHGASHKFVAERSAELLDRPDVAERVRRLYVDGPETPVEGTDLRVISCHLGGSSSVTGIRNGVAIGNSMGLSPQSGLPQNNRVGDLDSCALPFVVGKTGLSVEDAAKQLSSDGGLKGISGISNDLRDIQEAADAGDAKAQLAVDFLAHESRRWIGGYLLELGGLDALVFTAGIGENRGSLREAICRDLEGFGIVLDPAANADGPSGERVISAPDSPVRVLILPTNEELVVAREVQRFLQKRGTTATP